MPVTKKRKKIKLPFITFQVVTGLEALTEAQRKKRRADKAKAREARATARREQAKVASVHVQQHTKAQAARKGAPAPQAAPAPRSTVGAAVMPKPGRAAPTKRAASGQLCGQPNKTTGGTCKRRIATKPCPDHPAGRP